MAERYPLIMISGPAGSGKTSLIRQWIEAAQPKAAWYSLDEEDNDPDLFFRYLLATLAQTDERLEKSFCAMLTSQRGLRKSDVIPKIIDAVSRLSENIHLVLDDFHYVTNTKIHTTLAHFIQYIPDRLKLITVSRHRLPDPISAVAIKRELLKISALDLKFTDEETSDLFIPFSLSPAQIHKLNRHMEGWAVGLQLIRLSVKYKKDATDLTYIMNQAQDQLTSYLIQDILHMQSQKVRDFVFATALLDRFNPQLCAVVTNMADAERILVRLVRMNLFLIPLTSDCKWYRYHHMFSEVIRRRLTVDMPDMISEILRRTATWFAENNFLEDALRCAFRSKDYEFAADLMEDYYYQYIDHHDPMAGLRWMLKFPDKILEQRGLLRLQKCGFLLLLMEPVEVKKILYNLKEKDSPAFKRYSRLKREDCEDFRSMFCCIIQLFYSEDTLGAGQLEDLKHKYSSKNRLIGSAVEVFVMLILISKGELALSENLMLKSSIRNVGHKSLRQKFYLTNAKAVISRHRGRLCEAEALLNLELQWLHENKKTGIPSKFLLCRHLAYIFYLQNKMEKAREYAAIAFQHTEYDWLINEIKTGYELQFLLHIAAGRMDQAALRIKEIKTLSVKLNISQITAGVEVNAAQFAILQGNMDIVEQWSRQRNLKLYEPFSLLFAVECMTLARLRYACGRYSEAAQILETLRKRTLKRGLLEILHQIDILSVAVLHALNRSIEAKSILQQALAFSELEGYVRPYVNDAALITPILKKIAGKMERTSLSCHFQTVLTACKIFSDPTDTDMPSFPRHGASRTLGVLTRRELEILKWMAKGARNREIAHLAFISLNTVKTHVSRILTKLGVETRTQAILKAKEKKLISVDKLHSDSMVAGK